jgi:hypothetical protein
MNNSQIDNVKLELLPNSTTNDGLTSVSPSIAKPLVGSSAFGHTWSKGHYYISSCVKCGCFRNSFNTPVEYRLPNSKFYFVEEPICNK